MAQHICPWWGGYFIDNRLRRLLHNPERLLSPYLKPGMAVMDVGCGMGFFSIAMAKMIGGNGKVIAVDVQPQMLYVLERRRANGASVADRICIMSASLRALRSPTWWISSMPSRGWWR